MTGRIARRAAAAGAALALLSGAATAGTLTVTSGAQPAGATVAAGTAGTVIGRIQLAADAGTITVTSLQIANAGTAAAAEVQALQLFDDAAGTYLASGGWNGTAFAFRNLALDVTGTRVLRVVLSLTSGAIPGDTFQMRVPSGAVEVKAPDAVNAFTAFSGNVFTFASGSTEGDPAANSTAPVLRIVNPSDGGAVSLSPASPAPPPNNAFRVQVYVFNPGGLAALTSVKLSTDNGSTWPITLARNANYFAGDTSRGIWEVNVTTLSPGTYTLRAQAVNGVPKTVVSGPVVIGVNPARRGDGNLLVRDNSSQLCTDCHALAAHSSETTSSKYGSWATVCRDCHTPHNTTNVYLVKKSITPPAVNGFQSAKTVKFSTTTGDSNSSAASSASFANSDNSGPCQVCHTRTSDATGTKARWRNTGNTDAHYTAAAGTQPCTSCHSHVTGFAPSESGGNADCGSCHGNLAAPMSGAANYHHALNNTGVSSLASGTRYPSTSAPGSTADANRRCLMCHADHDLFRPDLNASGGRAKNLRVSANLQPGTGVTGVGFTATDFGYSSGTASVSGTTVTGTRTFFSGNVTAGASTWFWDRCDGRWYVVSAVVSDTQLTLTGAPAACASGAYAVVNLSGTDGAGLCISCHAASQAKSYAQNDATTTTPSIDPSLYRDSAHMFQVAATFDLAASDNAFQANCSKCHTDTMAKSKQTSLYPKQFGLHDSSVRRMQHPMGVAVVTGTATGTQSTTTLQDTGKTWSAGQFTGYNVTIKDANGVRTGIVSSVTAPSTLNLLAPWATAPINGTTTYTIADPTEEIFCMNCHSGGVAGNDYYGVKPMSQAANRFDQFLKFWNTGTLTVAASATSVTGAGTGWYSSGTGATFTKGSSTVTATGTNWTSALIGWSICPTAATPVRWYTIVAVNSPTSLVISPAYDETTAGNAPWATSIAGWSLRCNADTTQRWYSITNVTTATALTIYPGYGGAACSGSAYTAVPAAGHPMQLTAGQHRPVEGAAANWNAGSTRHATCSDCHDVHAAKAGNHAAGSGAIAGPNTGAWGLTATWASRAVTASFTSGSRTVTGTFLTTDAGKNIVGLDGLVYPIAAATTTSLTIGNTAGYKGTTGSGSVSIQDPVTAPTLAVKSRLTTADFEYQLCIKCHSPYGAATPAQTAFFTASGAGATQAQTDLSDDINPFQLAIHPIAGVGRNQPPATANANWASSTGRKTTAPNSGLDNTFVDGWGASSRVSCSDCHGSDSSEDPWGPHGSANPWNLKSIDPNVTVTVFGGGTPTVTYPNRCYYKGSANTYSGVPDTGDRKNFCLNCHRADVYGMVSLNGNTGGTSCNSTDQTTTVNPILYGNLSRVTHPADGHPQSNAVSNGALTRFGIFCLECHGGESIGALHGTNSTNLGSGASYRGKRFLVGATWIGVTRASTTVAVKCWTKGNSQIDAVNTCGQGHGGSSGNSANYDYDSGAD